MMEEFNEGMIPSAGACPVAPLLRGGGGMPREGGLELQRGAVRGEGR